jgi:hypothetical protein
LTNQRIKAYKPIIIQEVLNDYGALIWIESPQIFTSNNIQPFLSRAKGSGVLTWPLAQPISQLTHPNMFKYFGCKIKDFYFVHMLDTSQLVLFNKRSIHEDLMLPWVKCALKEECIAPLGSKYFGCDFNRKPLFHYSGCHRYEMSAFSIITSLLFDFELNKYSIDFENDNDKIKTNNNSYTIMLRNLFFANQFELIKSKEKQLATTTSTKSPL